jgi:hypothetical protein
MPVFEVEIRETEELIEMPAITESGCRELRWRGLAATAEEAEALALEAWVDRFTSPPQEPKTITSTRVHDP